MNINSMSSDELKFILNSKKEELEKFYNSEEYLWLENNKYIEEKYNKFLIKYKIYFYKRKSADLYLNKINSEIESIKNELSLRNKCKEEIIYKKGFDI